METRLRPAISRVPVLFTIIGLLAVLYILVPLGALAVRVPWGDFFDIARQPDTIELLEITLYAAAQAMVIATVLGVGLALWVQQLGRGSGVVRLLMYLPLAMPPVVGGLALTAAVGRRGLLAPVLDALGLQFAFNFSGVVVSHVFVTLPFVVVAVDSALRQMDQEIVTSAGGVGLGPWKVLTRVTFPTIAPSIFTGAALAFARSLGEFGTTITFAGSMPGITRTMPLGIYLERETSPEGAYALSAILILLAIASLSLAGLPALFNRRRNSRARALRHMDVAKVRELTRPAAGGADVTVTSNGITTVFPANQVTAVVGINGSGKSTLMNFVAGRLLGAPVKVGDRDITAVPMHERGVVMLTQRPGLPPTATSAQALTMVTGDKERTQALLEAAGLEELANVRVPDLSGGQAAQVALLRALAARPSVLILDEPLAAVDVASASRWRQLLHAAAADRTTLLVSHNALDISGLSSHLVVLDTGKVIAAGATEKLLMVPPNSFVADIAGWNMLTGTVTSTSATTASISSAGQTLTVPGGALEPGDDVVVTFRPSAAHLAEGCDDAATKAATPVLRGTMVAVVAASLDDTRASVAVGDSTVEIPVDPRDALALEPGTEVTFVLDSAGIQAHNTAGLKAATS